jgi:hypothetical protein
MSASTLFDKLREEMGIASDAALARELSVSQCVISQARREQSISDRMILRIHESTIWTAKEIRAELAQSAPHQYHDNPARVSEPEPHQKERTDGSTGRETAAAGTGGAGPRNES